MNTAPLLALLSPVLLAACSAFVDNGTHLAYDLEQGVKDLNASSANELVVHYQTLDAATQPYYVEITPSLTAPGQTRWSSYLVVSGKTSGGTSYHNRFVFVPERLYVDRPQGGTTDIVLRKDGSRISVVAVE